MEDSGKQVSTMGSGGPNLISDLKSLFSIIRTRRTMMFAYGFMFTFLIFTAFLAFSPSATSFSPWLNTFFSSSSSSSSYSSSTSADSSSSSYSSLFTFFFPNSSQSISDISPRSLNKTTELENSSYNSSTGINVITASPSKEQQQKLNQTVKTSPPVAEPQMMNQTVNIPLLTQTTSNQTANKSLPTEHKSNQTANESSLVEAYLNVTAISPLNSTESQLNQSVSVSEASKNETVKGVSEQKRQSNLRASLLKQSNGNNTKGEVTKEKKKKKSKEEEMLSSLKHCDIFDGNWVRDDSYPLYPPGSCPHIDESFNCFLNGRPDADFQKLRWQPKGCNIPRLNGRDMLELLRGKRLVFVGDSLNRNMWESLVCTLRNSVRDKTKVFEASGRREFRTENSYLFVFKDYNCTVEFFRSPFLVQEWEMPESNGSKKETLRLDLVERSSSKYKTADIIVFNTGHWWTHEKTSKGKDYYQEGSHVYDDLNVVEAFRKALTTWARWVDANVDPKKTLVFFRGYSASHFSGGQWNSGGQCNDETEPIKNETYLSIYPPKMRVLESVLNGMKMPVSYLNITRMTDYRKDAHPSVYRKLHLSEEERRSPLRYQDCSHWCLPGVPDAWNELLYAKLLVELNHKRQQQQKQHR